MGEGIGELNIYIYIYIYIQVFSLFSLRCNSNLEMLGRFFFVLFFIK